MEKHFLVIWPTIRKDWISVFFGLKDKFRFTFMPGTFPQKKNFAESFDCRYWSEFQSAQEVLDVINPDGVIFMSIETGLSMVLNHSAQKRGLKTYILQHGIFTNYRDYRIRERLWRKRIKANELTDTQRALGFSTLKFVVKSLRGKSIIWLFPLMLYTKLQRSIGPYWTARHFPISIKRANEYLCFSPFNDTIHRETDRVSHTQIQYIGSAELVKYLEKEVELIDDKFYLHIDQALAENSFGEETVSKEEMTNFYSKLNTFCQTKNARLYVKLHPESYDSNWLPVHENIVYLKGVENLSRYIQSAEGCFGFYSTMVIPAIYWKPMILFRIQYSGLQEALSELNETLILDFWSFPLEDIQFHNSENRDVIRNRFILPDGLKKNALESVLREA